MAPAMPCERPPNSITKVTAKRKIASEKNSKTVYGCIVDSHESTRQTSGIFSTPQIMKITLQVEGCTSMSHYNLAHKFIPMPQAMKIPDAKSRSGHGMEKVRDDPSIEFGQKSRAERRLFWKHKETKRKSILLD